VTTSYSLISTEQHGAVLHVQLNRAEKRNALNGKIVSELRDCFTHLPAGTRAVVLSGSGDHFCAGLDLNDVRGMDTVEGVHHSRGWHAAFEPIQFGSAPVIAVLKGAVVGGGLELASTAHMRVAEDSTFYALPEGTRGLFTGGGASVRVSRLIGVSKMADMMLTGRVYNADDGHRIGISEYRVGQGEGVAKALELAAKIADNSPTTNWAVMHALPRIADQSIQDGLLTESLVAAVAQSDPTTQQRLAAFLDQKRDKVGAPTK
jgi:(methylthio)acryloyl-CoA hydratase